MRPGWEQSSQWTFHAHKGDRHLCCLVAHVPIRNQWVAAALEGRASAATLSETFDQHAHETIGEHYGSAGAAMRAAERYARKWQAGTLPEDVEACPCGPIVEARGDSAKDSGRRLCGGKRLASNSAQLRRSDSDV